MIKPLRGLQQRFAWLPHIVPIPILPQRMHQSSCPARTNAHSADHASCKVHSSAQSAAWDPWYVRHATTTLSLRKGPSAKLSAIVAVLQRAHALAQRLPIPAPYTPRVKRAPLACSCSRRARTPAYRALGAYFLLQHLHPCARHASLVTPACAAIPRFQPRRLSSARAARTSCGPLAAA